MTVKAIFFDLGNVLLGFDWRKTVRELAVDCPLSPEEIGERLLDTRIVEFEMSRLTANEFFSDLRERIEYTGSVAELTRVCSDIFFPIEKNIALSRALSRNYLLGIISNTNQSHVDLVESRYDFFEVFDVVIYSCAVGLRKPGREIFDLARNRLGAEPGECVFVDDLEQNVAAARSFGWHAVQYLPDTDLAKELRALGVHAAGPEE
jgi:putative hydrolase of the HAD superfamily